MKIKKLSITLDRRTILCLYVPGFQTQVFKHVPNRRWIPLTRFTWILRTYTCNVNFVGSFILLRIPQQAKIASSSAFRNCKWIPQNISGIRKWKRILQTVKKFRNLFITELASVLAEFKSKDLTIVSGIHEQTLKHCLTKSIDVTLLYLQAVFWIIVLESQHRKNSLG